MTALPQGCFYPFYRVGVKHLDRVLQRQSGRDRTGPWSVCLEAGAPSGASPWGGVPLGIPANVSGTEPPILLVPESQEGTPGFRDHGSQKSSLLRRGLSEVPPPNRWILTFKPTEGLGWSWKKLTLILLKILLLISKRERETSMRQRETSMREIKNH